MKTKSPKGKTLAVIGAWLQIVPFLIFALGVIIQLVGIESDGFSFMFRAYLFGMAMSLSGAIMLFISLVFMKYRAQWFFRFMAIFSIYLVFKMSLFFTPLGIVIALYLLSKRSEFTTDRTDSPLQAGVST
tara:strand:- start:19 stop:408 length:390 start_codon:yes stop_codon:yes gene_type:complete